MKKTIWIILISLFGFMSCKSSQSRNQIKNEEKKNNESSVVPIKKDTNIYRINISFISIGGGIDNEVKLKYDTFVRTFEKQRGIKLSYEIAHWGKEGETDYCFVLAELKTKDKEQFVIESKNILQASKLVEINENTSCKNKK